MAIQKKVDLNEPVKAQGESKLEIKPLVPEYSEASLVLHGDFYRQTQTLFTKRVLWDRTVVSILVLILAFYNAYILTDYVEVSESLLEFLGLVRRSSELRTLLLFNSAILLGSIAFVGCSSFFISDEFRVISDKLPGSKYTEYIYGFDLQKFAKLDKDTKNVKEKKLLQNGINTQLVVYKDDPVGVITLKPIYEKSNDSTLMIKITGLSIRKAFKPFDFESLLIEWAFDRSKNLLKAYLKDKKIKNTKGCKVTLLVDNYSFNTSFEKVLLKYQFNKVQTEFNYNPTEEKTAIFNGLINKLFKSSRDVYAVHIVDNS